MNVAALAPRKTLTLSNKNGRIGRLKSDLSDFSLSDPEKNSRILSTLESESVTTTLQESKIQKIQNIMNAMQPLIQKRNKIIAYPFLWIVFPWRKQELKEIDTALDKLEWQLYMVDNDDSMTASVLNKIEQNATAKLNKYSMYLKNK